MTTLGHTQYSQQADTVPDYGGYGLSEGSLRTLSVADPGFPVGGGGVGQLRFVKFVCQNERIGSLGGGGGAPGAAPLNPPMIIKCHELMLM